jgi:hypothetical protein
MPGQLFERRVGVPVVRCLRSRLYLHVVTKKRHPVRRSSGTDGFDEGDPDAQAACLPADNYFDSILVLYMRTGEVNWATFALSDPFADPLLDPLSDRRVGLG